MLTEHERAVLDVASRTWKYAGAKEDHVRRTTGLTPIRYYQVLNSLTGNADAWEYAPQALARVVRLRERNRLRRTA